MSLDQRAENVLKNLVETYIQDGQPVGSRTLSKLPSLGVSSATVRNVMSDLEELGLITSPHTSAGRIPTVKGYRLFVDSAFPYRLFIAYALPYRLFIANALAYCLFIANALTYRLFIVL